MPERISPPRPRGRRLAALVAATTAAVFGATLLAAPAAMAAPATYGSLTLAVDDTSVTEGDTVTVTIAADTVAELYAYDLDVSYDPALLSYDVDSAVYPSGGFGDALVGTEDVTFSSTRLGTSPGLAGAQTLVSFTFTALAAGSAAIALDSGTLIGTAGETTPVDTTAAALDATVVIAAAPVPPVDGGGPAPAPPVTELPVTGTPAGGGSTGADPLASTGADATPWIATGIVSAALVALGAVLVIRRRQVAGR
jgi:LPXTG-motif cell wall-anchored protein